MAADLLYASADNSYCIETQRRICSRHPTLGFGWFFENCKEKSATGCREMVQASSLGS
jgi:hypothetical protein